MDSLGHLKLSIKTSDISSEECYSIGKIVAYKFGECVKLKKVVVITFFGYKLILPCLLRPK